MSDSLRTKIIESLTGKTIVVSDGYDGYSIIERDAAEVLADAVIRELGQPHLAKRIINGKPDQWVRRYTTDWEIVDE